jgi:CheY-like chemotaxis protein
MTAPLILVADDDADIRALVTVMLETRGHRVIQAGTGMQAVRRARQEAPDLVVLDIKMPEIDGWEAARRIRAFSGAPILFVTAQVDVGTLERCRAVRSGEFVAKPFLRRELVGAVGRLLHEGVREHAGARERSATPTG